MVSAIESDDSGWKNWEGSTTRSAVPAPEADRGDEGWRADTPVLLGSAVPVRQPESPRDTTAVGAQLEIVAAPANKLPRGWPTRAGDAAWAAMALQRPPRAVIVAGAEGGVGTSTVAALLGETLAASSPGPSMVVDQSGSPWGSLSRRLLGQRAGLAGHRVLAELDRGGIAAQLRRLAPTTPAGAAVVDDGPAYSALPRLFTLVRAMCGSMVVDGGRVDAVLTARLDPPPLVVLVGRADVIGAEALCAALGFLRERHAGVHPVVVLSSATPTDRRRFQAARKLVATAGVTTLVHLSYDAALATGRPLRLDHVGKTTATSCLEVLDYINRGPPRTVGTPLRR